jgi:hypothetical protein
MKTNKYPTIKLLTIIGCFSALLGGCTTFGVDNSTWKQLTPDQRKIAMQNYYQAQTQQEAHQAEIDKINAQNAPLTDAISAVGGLAAAKQ